MKKQYKFIKFANVMDNDSVVYALEHDGVEKQIDGAKFIEVTPDFERVSMVRADSLKPIGFTIREY
jgi:hypothetical protein